MLLPPQPRFSRSCHHRHGSSSSSTMVTPEPGIYSMTIQARWPPPLHLPVLRAHARAHSPHPRWVLQPSCHILITTFYLPHRSCHILLATSLLPNPYCHILIATSLLPHPARSCPSVFLATSPLSCVVHPAISLLYTSHAARTWFITLYSHFICYRLLL